MKTCTNPKCNATGIPDDAMFCPVCGEALVEVTNPWKEKYEAFQKKREELLIKKKQLSLFETARQKMFSTLKQDGNFEAAMQENVDIIRKKRKNELSTGYIVGMLFGIIGFVLLIVGAIMSIDDVSIVGGIILFVGVFILTINSIVNGDQPISPNTYITNFLTPFIEGHLKDYVDADVSNYIPGILESEIIDPEEISKKISQRIEELDKQIENIDHQIQLMHQMQQIE